MFTGTQAGPAASQQVFAEEFKKTNIGLIYAEKGPVRQMLRLYCWEFVRDRLLGSRQKKKKMPELQKKLIRKERWARNSV